MITRAWFVRAGVTTAVGVSVLLALLLVIETGGYDLRAATFAMWYGSFGSTYALFSATLVRATPLILLGLAVALAFRAGVLNIGGEGQFLAGASAAVAAGLAGGSRGWPGFLLVTVELACGVAAGCAWSMVAAVLKRWFGVLEVISTLMLNFIAQQGVSYLVRGPLQEPTHIYPQTSSLVSAAKLPVLIDGQRLHLGLPCALAIALFMWCVLRWTAPGFRIRAIGAGARAATSAGRVHAEAVVFGVFLASGSIAGFAGAVEATGVTYALYEGISPGFGYTAIAVALLARLNPMWVIGTGVFFGALEAGAAAMQRDAGVPSVFVAVIEAIVVLGVLAMDRARQMAGSRLTAAEPSV